MRTVRFDKLLLTWCKAMKPRHELAEVVQRYGNGFLRKHPQSFQVVKTLDAIARCRTASLGGHQCQCNRCGHKRYFYNSCRNVSPRPSHIVQFQYPTDLCQN